MGQKANLKPKTENIILHLVIFEPVQEHRQQLTRDDNAVNRRLGDRVQR